MFRSGHKDKSIPFIIDGDSCQNHLHWVPDRTLWSNWNRNQRERSNYYDYSWHLLVWRPELAPRILLWKEEPPDASKYPHRAMHRNAINSQMNTPNRNVHRTNHFKQSFDSICARRKPENIIKVTCTFRWWCIRQDIYLKSARDLLINTLRLNERPH